MQNRFSIAFASLLAALTPLSAQAEYSVSVRSNGDPIEYTDRDFASLEVTDGPSYGFASASIPQGALRAFASTDGGGIFAESRYRDTISFFSNTEFESFLLPVKWTFHGESFLENGFFQSIGDLAIGDSVLGGVLSFQKSIGSHESMSINEVFEGSFLVVPNRTYSIGSDLLVSIGGKGFVDFRHTAFLRFDLPDGIGIRSSSGTFLSDPIGGGVPEPASWAFMVAGFGLVGTSIRFRPKVSFNAAG